MWRRLANAASAIALIGALLALADAPDQILKWRGYLATVRGPFLNAVDWLDIRLGEVPWQWVLAAVAVGLFLAANYFLDRPRDWFLRRFRVGDRGRDLADFFDKATTTARPPNDTPGVPPKTEPATLLAREKLATLLARVRSPCRPRGKLVWA